MSTFKKLKERRRKRRQKTMEPYEKLELEVIRFETEDIITTSVGDTETSEIVIGG